MDSLSLPETAGALLEAMRMEPHPSAAEVAELEAAIEAGKLPVCEQGEN